MAAQRYVVQVSDSADAVNNLTGTLFIASQLKISMVNPHFSAWIKFWEWLKN